jgi:hypothetical protein
MRVPTTIVVIILCAPGGPAAAQPSLDTGMRLDSVARQAVRIGQARGPEFWPGFRPDTIPALFVLQGKGSFLFNWRGPLPPQFSSVPDLPGAGWQESGALGAASTASELGGRTVAQVVVGIPDPASLLATLFHEAFHVFQRVSAGPERKFGKGENSYYVATYPIFSESNEALFALEGRILAAALEASTLTRKRELAREFVAVRRARHRGLDGSFSAFDRASELNEGLAEYVLVRTLELQASDPSLPAAWRTSARRHLEDARQRLVGLTGNLTQSFRLRFYSTGPAQARLLDALAGAGWKSRLLAENRYLDEALAEASGLDAAEQRAFAQAVAGFDSGGIRREAVSGIARLQELRARQVDSLLSQPGLLLELSAADLPRKAFDICSFDPQNHLQVTPTVQIQTRWWRPCAGRALSGEFNVPSVIDTELGTIRAVIGPETEVKLTAGGNPVVLAEGQTIAEALEVQLQAPRASIRAPRAKLTREVRILRIIPLP